MLSSLSKRKHPPFPLLSYFYVVVCPICLLCHNLSLIAYTFKENLDFVSIIIGQFVMSANSRIRFGFQIVFVFCTLHHLIIIIVQTYLNILNLENGCQVLFVACVNKFAHIHSVIHYTICGSVCFQFTHFLFDDSENKYTLSYYH